MAIAGHDQRSPRIGRSRSSWPSRRSQKKSGSIGEGKAERIRARCRALLRLTARTDPGTAARSQPRHRPRAGRLDRAVARPPPRRGADQLPGRRLPGPAIGRRPGATAPLHLREQMLVTLGLWPMFPKTPLNPQVYGKLDRDGYTIEKVVLETFPGFTLSGNLYRPAEATGKVPGHPLPARPLGGRPRQSRGPAALHPLGQARLRRLPVRHGRLQRQQAVHARVPERPPAALGPEPAHAPDLEQHPGARLADLAARRRRRADRLHGRIGRRHPDLPADGARRPHQGLGAGGHGLRHVPGRLRLRERRRACGTAPTTSSSPRCAPRARCSSSAPPATGPR